MNWQESKQLDGGAFFIAFFHIEGVKERYGPNTLYLCQGLWRLEKGKEDLFMFKNQLEKPLPFYKSLIELPLLRLDLQHFSDSGKEDDHDDKDEDDDKGEEETLTLTKKELEEQLQRESDKRVSAALKKREEKLRKEMEERIEQERKDAEQLAKLSAEERARVEAEKRELALKKREEEFAEKEREFQRKQLEMDTVEVLRERKLPTRFTKFLVAADAESTLETIVSFQEEWQEAIEAEVNKRLATDTPLVGTKKAGSYNPWKKDSFNLTEQARILKDNPELAKKLKAQAGK